MVHKHGSAWLPQPSRTPTPGFEPRTLRWKVSVLPTKLTGLSSNQSPAFDHSVIKCLRFVCFVLISFHGRATIKQSFFRDLGCSSVVLLTFFFVRTLLYVSVHTSIVHSSVRRSLSPYPSPVRPADSIDLSVCPSVRIFMLRYGVNHQ